MKDKLSESIWNKKNPYGYTAANQNTKAHRSIYYCGYYINSGTIKLVITVFKIKPIKQYQRVFPLLSQHNVQTTIFTTNN